MPEQQTHPRMSRTVLNSVFLPMESHCWSPEAPAGTSEGGKDSTENRKHRRKLESMPVECRLHNLSGSRWALDTYANGTIPDGFILLGFSDKPRLEMTLFVTVSVFYTVTLVGNATIILLSHLDPHLHTPIHFFLTHLSILDLCLTASCIPQMLVNFWGSDKTVSYLGCAVQLYIFLGLGAAERVLLLIMAFDRYMAVCRPLHYAVIMHPPLCHKLAFLVWASGIFGTLVPSPTTMKLPFCHHHRVDDFVCEVPALIRLACRDTHINKLQISVIGAVFLMGLLLLILVSYGRRAQAVLAIPSLEGRSKAFRTCFSHLVVVFLFYCSVTAVYIRPRSHFSQKGGKFLSLFYTVVTPTLNPLIYI
ncbi:olfactory receptor 2H2-like [Eumetopias jubatus]|uniref:olfactory receptor 2H2-like n=1 Tax=Eumetopias jubatus TaxID=34886 RepID=UPI0010171310|nr:olfactory receptor 2H2-like [Eumetopias jubatus]